jgi:excisionase family DNA binding protein
MKSPEKSGATRAPEIWLSKQEAMRFLDRRIRAFERIAANAEAAGKLRKHRTEPGPGRPYSEVSYHAGDLEAIRAEMANGGPKTAALTPPPAAAGPGLPPETGEALLALVQLCGTIMKRLEADPALQGVVAAPPVPFAYLSITEAAALIGMPARWITTQIRAGRLPAERTSGGWRVRTKDLEALPPRFHPAPGDD